MSSKIFAQTMVMYGCNFDNIPMMYAPLPNDYDDKWRRPWYNPMIRPIAPVEMPFDPIDELPVDDVATLKKQLAELKKRVKALEDALQGDGK